jgi:hypothetical protein
VTYVRGVAYANAVNARVTQSANRSRINGTLVISASAAISIATTTRASCVAVSANFLLIQAQSCFFVGVHFKRSDEIVRVTKF